MDLTHLYERAKEAGRGLLQWPVERVNEVLRAVADEAVARTEYILAENARDLARMSPDNPLYDRLKLTAERIQGIASDTRHVAELPSPLGRVLKHTVLPNRIGQFRDFFFVKFLAGLFPVGSDFFQGKDDRFISIFGGVFHKDGIEAFSKASFLFQNVSRSFSLYFILRAKGFLLPVGHMPLLRGYFCQNTSPAYQSWALRSIAPNEESP